MKKTLWFSLAFISRLCFAILKQIISSIFIFFQNLKRKRIIAIFLFVLVTVVTKSNAQSNLEQNQQLKTINYNLDIHLDYENGKIVSTCSMTVMNTTAEESKIIPLLLYRLMRVTSIKDETGTPLSYTQKVVSFEDWEKYQVNYIEVIPARHLPKGDSCKLTIEYQGYLFGYTETGMGYVRDKIDPEFTILRPDCKAYPELGYPSEKINRLAGFAPSFNYEIKIHVPDSLVAVNGGALISKETKDGYCVYTYRNTKLAWRMDIAIGKYKVLETPLLKIYYLEQDSAGAETVFKYAQRTLNLYTEWWGKLIESKVFSVIEIPSGYGSQADETCILQSADAFNDSTQMRQLYHEVSHLWNVNSNDQYYSRWNEGLATFVEYLTIEKLENRLYLDYVSDWYLKLIKKEIESDSLLRVTPLIDFGKMGIESYSYEVGMIMFQVLYQVMGENDFNKCIHSYYSDYYSNGATTDEFVATAKKVSAVKLSIFFDDWIYTTKYTELIKSGLKIDEMSKLYRSE
ncbi:MAG: hypothetical protein A2X22_02865 [Bacteroidetes bacterium GWF2_49_14]|nr:MAG: hypothetical protein A2X22_02865 [Bacteroidetes bacterium GWF2_49_14]